MNSSKKPPPNKWALILRVSLLNTLVTTIIVISYGMFVGFEELTAKFTIYGQIYKNYISPTEKFSDFIKFTCVVVGGEEILYRLLPWLFMLLVYYLYEKRKIDDDKTGAQILIWIPFIVANYYWTINVHTSSPKFALIGIFAAGLTWSWLIIKTRDWTSSVIAHLLANTTIFLFVQAAIFFGFKP